MKIAYQHFVILGLGDTGFATALYLTNHQAQVTVFDHQKNPKNLEKLRQLLPQVKFHSGKLDEALLHEADHVVVSPGIPLSLPEIVAFKQNGGSILGDVALFSAMVANSVSGKIIAITGSNGKSTVTKWVEHLCSVCGCDVEIAGNIGVPVLDVLLKREKMQKIPDYWVLELSSFQLETTDCLAADIATVLNISEDHLDRYPDLMTYAKTKSKIFNGKGMQVINQDDVFCLAMKKPGRSTFSFSLKNLADYSLSKNGWLTAKGIPFIKADELPLQGSHHIANALCAFSLCDLLGLPMPLLVQGLKTFHGLSHRTEWVDQIDGVTYIDDSKGTNVAATEAAIFSMRGKVVLIAGGQAKGQDFSPLKTALEKNGRAVVLIGQDADQIYKALINISLPIKGCKTLEEATQMAALLAKKGDTVLLSPACASLDMFDSYKHRGEVFCEAVFKLKK